MTPDGARRAGPPDGSATGEDLKFLYFGLPLGALLLLADGIRLRAVCLSQLGPGLRRLRSLAAGARIALYERPEVERPEVEAELCALGHDVLLSWFWTRRLPAALLRSAARGAFGVHPSLLPRWRGPDPYFWAIRAGDVVTGVTAHRLEADYDTGAIVASRELPIAPTDDAWRLARRLDRPSLALLRETAARLVAGERLDGTPQDEARATWAPAPDDEACTLRWSLPAEELARVVRAAAPAPGALAVLGETPVTVIRAKATERVPRALLPGEAVLADEGVVVRAAQGGLVLLRVSAARDTAEVVLEGHAIARLLPGIADVRRAARAHRPAP